MAGAGEARAKAQRRVYGILRHESLTWGSTYHSLFEKVTKRSIVVPVWVVYLSRNVGNTGGKKEMGLRTHLDVIIIQRSTRTDGITFNHVEATLYGTDAWCGQNRCLSRGQTRLTAAPVT